MMRGEEQCQSPRIIDTQSASVIGSAPSAEDEQVGELVSWRPPAPPQRIDNTGSAVGFDRVLALSAGVLLNVHHLKPLWDEETGIELVREAHTEVNPYSCVCSCVFLCFASRRFGSSQPIRPRSLI